MLKMLISRLWVVGLIHNQGFLDHQVSGISMNVGIRIFSIVGGLGFEHSRCRSRWMS